MRISEISPDLVTGATAEAQPLLLIQELESLVKESEALSPTNPSAAQSLAANLQKTASRLTSRVPLPESSKLQIWKLSYRLWNACVDLSNSVQIRSDGGHSAEEHHAKLRQVSADLLFLAGNPAGIPSPFVKAASFFYKTGMIWHELKRFDLAAGCFERATDLTSTIQLDRNSDGEEKKLLLDLNIARSRTAWEVSDRNLAIALLNRSKNILFGSPTSYRTLAEQYLHFGKLDLSKNQKPESSSKLLNEALDLCEKGIGVSRRPDETLVLENLKARCLRFLAAERFQAEDYEGVLKCVRVLREKGGKEEEHPTVGFVSLRAWLGLGKVGEAERELRAMMVNRGVPESVYVAAAEAYVAVAGAEAAKGVLMGLVGRCRLGPASALRVVQRVVEGGGGGRVRVAAELVSDERVVALFAGSSAMKDRGAMHAILWNCGAEHFRGKDYETAAEMIEKSMLYIGHGEENRARRANCHRVLCLCHLGLSQLDRAQEFINEAEKLEPNINCVFLKFKIYLLKQAEKEAINQIQAMVNCIDFNPEYLTLSTHEAIACQSAPVAISSLSVLLNLYSPGKKMPMTEVATLRNLITLLCQTPEPEPEVIKYTRRARARMSEIGAESFFGKGAVGSRELNWFAGNSWNMGLKAGKEKNFESCMEFLELASEFYGVLVDDEAGVNNTMVCKALILSVAAMLGSEEKSKIALTDSDIKKALGKLDRASKILLSASTSSTQLGGDQPAMEPSLFFLHTFSAYQLTGRLIDDPHSKQLQLIKNYVSSSRSSSVQNLLQLGLFTTQGPNPNLEAADYALNACLSSLLASPMPDYQTVGLILRKLAGFSGHLKGDTGGDDGAYGVYLQAYRIIVGLKDGEYPAEEGKWLAMTAWNKSGSAIRLGQVEVARKWMKMGLDLARHLPSMSSYVGGMEECLASFEKSCNGGGC